MASITFDPLKKALMFLEDILKQPFSVYMRAGIVQCFENTFELSWKAMQRVLKQQGVETGSPMQVFRAAKKAGFIDDVNNWAALLKARNLTVHTYNDTVAQEVFEAAVNFPEAVHELIARLEKETM